MSEAAPEYEGEIVETRPSRGAIRKHAQPWEPSPLAALEDDEFDERLVMAAREVERMKAIQKSVMKPDVDYGVIPGTDKPTLYQPGAQILNRMAGLRARYTEERTDGDGETAPHIAYRTRCELIDRDGNVVAEGLGSANTWEKKHRYRYNDRTCPKCGAAEVRPSQYEEKYWCRGCKAKFKDRDPDTVKIDAQPRMMENPDPHELDNTVLKISAKRSLIAATVNAHACSGIFAQDIEPDSPGQQEQNDAQKTTRAAKPAAKKAAAKKPASSEGTNDPIGESRMKMLWATIGKRLAELGRENSEANKQAVHDLICTEFELESFSQITNKQFPDVFEAVKGWDAPKSDGK